MTPSSLDFFHLNRNKGLDMTSHDKRTAAAAAIAVDDAGPKVTQARASYQRELPLLEPMDDYPTRINDSPRPGPKRAPEYLDDAAAVYRQRNKLYGDNYRKFGLVMLAIYPDGLTLKTVEDFNRLGVFVQCLAKLSRYAETLPSGGHADSALDLATYAAMLRELTDEAQ